MSIVTAVLSSVALAEAETLNRWSICVDMQVVSIAPDATLSFVSALRGPRESDEAFKKLQTMIESGEATLVAWPVSWARDGETSFSETDLELRYLSEFEPPQSPQNFGSGPEFHASPVGLLPSIDSRNSGVTLEIRPRVSLDGAWIDLGLDVQQTRFVEFREYKVGKAYDGDPLKVQVPEFCSARTKTQMFVRSGRWNLIAAVQVPKPVQHTELFLVRATAHSIPK